jgi:hypothetical protein
MFLEVDSKGVVLALRRRRNIRGWHRRQAESEARLRGPRSRKHRGYAGCCWLALIITTLGAPVSVVDAASELGVCFRNWVVPLLPVASSPVVLVDGYDMNIFEKSTFKTRISREPA